MTASLGHVLDSTPHGSVWRCLLCSSGGGHETVQQASRAANRHRRTQHPTPAEART